MTNRRKLMFTRNIVKDLDMAAWARTRRQYEVAKQWVESARATRLLRDA